MSQGNRAMLLVVSPIPPGTRDDPVDMKKSVPHCHWVAFSCKYLQKNNSKLYDQSTPTS